MATLNYLLQYGVYYLPGAEAAGEAAIVANGGSLVYNLTPEAAIAIDPINSELVVYGISLSSLPGTITLGTYTPVTGTPGITYSPNTISTGTLTTAVTRTTYGSFLNVMSVDTINYTWKGVIITAFSIGTTPNPFFFTGTPIPTSNTFTGKWQQQVITYTGDGVSDRLIPTTFSLATGVVSVWVFPGVTRGPSFRNNSMSGTAGNSSGIDVNGGIQSFVAGGFTVKDDIGQLRDVNRVGISYTAVVLSDTTSDNRYMRVGSYPGTADATKIVTISGATRQLTQLWIFGRGGQSVFCSDDFTVGNSVSFGIEAKPVTNQITALGVGQFTIGNDNNVDDVGIANYFYVAFSIPIGNSIRNQFQTYKSPLGTGAPVNVSLSFSPTFAIAREYTVALPSSVWRGPLQTGTNSTSYQGTNNPTGGIEALGANLITLGTTVLPNGENAYGFALKSGTVPAPTVFTPPPGVNPPSPPNGAVVIDPSATITQWLLERSEVKSRQEEHVG